jgi:hypothetical protein
MNEQAPVILFGEGSSSIFLLQELLKRNEKILWIAGSGARLLPVMPSVKSPLAMATLIEGRSSLETDPGLDPVIEQGVCHRVYRTKAFKLPVWKRYSDPQAREEAFLKETWAPEQAWIACHELAMKDLHPVQIEEGLRAVLENDARITRVAHAPVLELEIFERGGKIQLANGLISDFKQLYYCDDLASLKSIPKLLTVFKHQLGTLKAGDRMSALQVVFHHSTPLKQEIRSGLVVPLNRDAGETFDRNVLGGFITPDRSVWTVFLQASECEDNHEIMKKLRKLKQALNRAFDSPEFLPEGKKEFMATVDREQVRFESGSLLSGGTIRENTSNPDFILLNDALGFSETLERIARHFHYEAVDLEAYSEASVDPESSGLDLTGIELPAHLMESAIQEMPSAQV